MPGSNGTTTTAEERDATTTEQGHGPSEDQLARIGEALGSAGLDNEDGPAPEITDDDEGDGEPKESPRDERGRFAPREKPKGESDQIALVPPHLLTAARRDHWTDEEIHEFVADVGAERATRTFEKMRKTQIGAGQRFAELGRRIHESNGSGSQPNNGRPHAPRQQRDGSGFSPPAIEGDDPFKLPDKKGVADLGFPEEVYDKIVAPMQRVADAMRESRAATQRLEMERNAATANAALTQVETFFKTLVPTHADVYGKGSMQTIPEALLENRLRVIEMADMILIGAKESRHPMTAAEALESAHELFSARQRPRARDGAANGAANRARRTPLGRPTASGEASTLTADQRAMRAADEVDRKAGGTAFFTGD